MNIIHLLKQNIVKIFLIALIVRLLLSFLPPFEIDQIGWRAWSYRMAEEGPSNFYSKDVFTDNPPGFLYVFWLIGEIKTNFFSDTPTNFEFDFLLKLPTNLADLLSGLIIYKLIRRKFSEKAGLMGFTFYVFNPTIFLNTSIWGQFDGFATLFLLLTLYLLIEKKFAELSAIAFAIAWSIKPQALAFAPFYGMLMLTTTKPKTWISSGLVFLATTLLIYLPFFPNNPLLGFIEVNKAMTGIFTCTTCYAFNYWGIFGNWLDDQALFWNLPLTAWGLILVLISFIPILFLKPFNRRFQEPFLYFTAAISIFSFFTFLTRMHERYLFPFFAFFLLAAIFLNSKKLLYLYFVISLINFLNQYYAYGYYNFIFPEKTDIFNPPLITFLADNFKIFSFISFAYFIFLVIYFLIIIRKKAVVDKP